MCEVKGETNVCSAHVENSSDFIHSPRESTSIAVDQSSVERDEEHLSLETYFLDVSRACFFFCYDIPHSRGGCSVGGTARLGSSPGGPYVFA